MIESCELSKSNTTMGRELGRVLEPGKPRGPVLSASAERVVAPQPQRSI